CGFCFSCWHTIGCMDCTGNGFICRWSSLTPCTTLGWRCTSLAFFCSTWFPILPCVLSDVQTLPDSILPEAEQPKQQGLYALTVAEEPLFPRAFSALLVRSTHSAPKSTSHNSRTSLYKIS